MQNDNPGADVPLELSVAAEHLRDSVLNGDTAAALSLVTSLKDSLKDAQVRALSPTCAHCVALVHDWHLPARPAGGMCLCSAGQLAWN